jgi:hypothetical protein
MTATENFNGVLRAADINDEEDVALRAAIVAALRQDVAGFGVFTRCGGRCLNAFGFRHRQRGTPRPAAVACNVRDRIHSVTLRGGRCRHVR